MGQCFCCKSMENEHKPLLTASEDEIAGSNTDIGENNTDSINSEKPTMQPENKSNNLTMKNNKTWNATQTEQLEHELEKEIAVKQYESSRDDKDTHQLDDVLEHSLNIEDATTTNVDAEQRNIFRYQSKEAWDHEDLDKQTDEMQKQLTRLQTQNNIDNKV
eukprot:525028_1